MRQIGTLDNEQDARRFGAYLLTQGVKNTVEEGNSGGAWSVWVEDDDLLDRGRSELAGFRGNAADPRYDAAVGHAEKLRRAAEKEEQRRRKQFVDVRTRWGQPSQFARPVTIALVALSIIVAVGTKLGFQETALTNALRIVPWIPVTEELGRWASLGDTLSHGQVWRIVTPIFIHFGPLHLIFNMFWLLDLGSMVETRRGSRFLLVFVLVTAVISNLAQYAMSSGHPNFGGMSGVVYGLFGYVWIKGRVEPHLGMGVSQQTVIIMLAWLVICMVPGVLPVNVANTAHVVGLLAGVASAYAPYAVRRARRGR
jgi:GlpG protein